MTTKIVTKSPHDRNNGHLPAVVAKQSISAEVQRRFVVAHGNAGIVVRAALCGLYAIMGNMTTAFDIELEEGLPAPPF